MSNEVDPFNINHPDLCECLRWKGMFIDVSHEPSESPARAGHFWCVYTQTCIGPDGQLAQPDTCSSTDRACHGKGYV
jgi:hypothetical protein